MKEAWAWLRTRTQGGDYPIPNCGAEYNAHLALFDAALPLNGGTLQADGSWLQETWRYSEPFPQELPNTSRGAGHFYMPGVGNDVIGVQAVLDDESLQQVAGRNLLNLALSGRFDSPWDGVYLDLEGIPSSYKPQLNQFLYLLAYRLHSSGLLFGVSVRGKTSDPGTDYDDAYSYDFGVVAQVADFVDLRCYGFWNPASSWMQRTIGPHWWIDRCIEYALKRGIPAQRMTIGLATHSRYYPNSNDGAGRVDITYTHAMQMAAHALVDARWIERDNNGLVRERIVDLGASHIIIHDSDTHFHGLELADKYGLLGTTLFTPSTSDQELWSVLEEWRG